MALSSRGALLVAMDVSEILSARQGVFVRKPVRLLTLTTLFPNGRNARHGIFVANRLRRLCDTGRVAATVVAAIPWFPGAYRDRAAIAATETISGLQVHHPRFINVPGVGMRIQPDLLARTLIDELRRIGADTSGFDVIDAHYFYPDGVAAARIADELGLPLVISARGSDINSIGRIAFARERMRRAAERAQALIAVSSDLAKTMAELGMPEQRIHVLRNGVDTEMFAPFSRSEARARFGLPNSGSWVLGVGNLVPEKGFELLIHAIAGLDDVRLVLVGEGPLRSQLAALGKSLAPNRVAFRANMPQEQLRYAYAAANVLALPSLREGWPNVVLEALACGTPVVASAVGGLPEILPDGAPGRLVLERKVDVWRNALRDVLDAPILAERAHAYAGKFGWDEVIAQQVLLYERVGARDSAVDAFRATSGIEGHA